MKRVSLSVIVVLASIILLVIGDAVFAFALKKYPVKIFAICAIY